MVPKESESYAAQIVHFSSSWDLYTDSVVHSHFSLHFSFGIYNHNHVYIYTHVIIIYIYMYLKNNIYIHTYNNYMYIYIIIFCINLYTNMSKISMTLRHRPGTNMTLRKDDTARHDMKQ